MVLRELLRILNDNGRIMIFTSNYGWGIGLIWKKIWNIKNRLTTSDVAEGHLNRFSTKEIKKILTDANLEIEEKYNYSIIFQQITDLPKDYLSRIISSFVKEMKKNKSNNRAGQDIKTKIKQREDNYFINLLLTIISRISYFDAVILGRFISGASIFLKLKKIE